MLERLLESRSKKARSPAGALVSVTAHATLIAAAVYATAESRVVAAPRAETVRAIYFPPPIAPARRAPPAEVAPQPIVNRPLIFVDPVDIGAQPEIDLTDIVTRTGRLPTGPTNPAPDGPPREGSGGEAPGATPFSADQVERQVSLAPGSLPPRYPELLRSAGVEGAVTALFVVDSSGRMEKGSILFPRSDNTMFEEAVRAALERMRFIPAEVGGRKVRQLVQMPFVFTLSK